MLIATNAKLMPTSAGSVTPEHHAVGDDEEARRVDDPADEHELEPSRTTSHRRDRQSADEAADAADAVHDAERLGSDVQLRSGQNRQERHV